MLERAKLALKRVNDWLMTPVVAAKRLSRRFFVQSLRSRFFMLCAALTALPLFFSASAFTWKAERSWITTAEIDWLLWVNALLAWVLFSLTVGYNYCKLNRSSRRTDPK